MSTDTERDITQELPPPPPPQAVGSNGGTEDDSILAGLRVERKRVLADTTTVIDVPGYEDSVIVPGHEQERTPLACQYGVIGWEQQRVLERRMEDVPVSDDYRELNFWMDQLITACQSFGVVIGGEFKPLSKSQPVRWGDPRLVEVLGLDPGERSARAILYSTFVTAHGPERAPYAISAHHTAVIAWMHGGQRGGASAEADEEFVAKNS